jgi:hypothetical protein
MTRPARLSVYPDDAILHGRAETGVWDGAQFTKRRRARPERAIQIAIKKHLALYGIVVVHVPNEGKRTTIAGRLIKQEGVLPGFPDLVLLAPGGRVAFVEVKAPGGRLSDRQRECHAMLARLGHNVLTADNQDAVVNALKTWRWV